MENEITTSPTPKKKAPVAEPQLLDFIDALRALIGGKKVSKQDWEDPEYYGIMDTDRDELHLHKPDGKFYQWILSEGDITGEDYYIIN